MIQEIYSIESVKKGDDTNFLKALKIYDNITPVDIKTEPQDIIYWIENKVDNFKMYIFNLYCDKELIGLAMTTYLPKVKTLILEYIALENNYRKNVVYLSYLNLIGKFFKESKYSINYWLTDINNKNNGKETDSESKILTILLDIEGYKKIDALFLTPELGITDIPGFEAYFMIKSTDDISSLAKNSYQSIIDNIYFDYYLEWYKGVIPTQEEFSKYKQSLNDSYNKLKKHIIQIKDPILVVDTGYEVKGEITGHTPIHTKNRFFNFIKTIAIYLLITLITIVAGTIVGLLIIETLLKDIGDKGAVIAATITATTAIPIIGQYSNYKRNNK
ncbi:MAG: hypothetical protein ACTTHM_08145 [Peptoanaerobacter stomatis]|uniref:hypothetical protein n=1 Tax=Peptoanaerobacter stomatis TaxID=796937 RepID=UPI003FA0818F